MVTVTMNKADWVYYNDLLDFMGNDYGYYMSDYDELLRCLYETEFYILDDVKDDSWFDDIYMLRTRLDYDGDGENDNYNVLEAIIAISCAIENQIMSNSEYGDRTVLWFWTILENLEIVFKDKEFDLEYTQAVLDRWLSRKFERNGDGSPFPLKNSNEDLRYASIWRMAQLYLTENFKGRW